MYRFDEFVEHWATIYRPMLHQPGRTARNRRFFLTDTYMGLVDFMTQIRPDQSPCVVMESAQEGTINDRFDYPRYSLYFMVRAADMSDGRSAMEAKVEAKEHLLKFLNYLRSRRDDRLSPYQRLLQNIKTDGYLDYQTIGPMYDGWFGVTVTLENLIPYSLCVNGEDYVEG